MKFIILLISLYLLGNSQNIEMGQKCQCQDILTQHDCLQLGSCDWDSYNMKCSQTTKQYTTRYILENRRSDSDAYSFYCEGFDQLSCPNQRSCAWFKNRCTFFTGCTAYLRPTHEECQALSIKCISDGYQCISIQECQMYKNYYSCTKTEFGQYCYWNRFNNQCELPDSCSKLPKTLTTHQECNSQFNFCTVDSNGGCVLMGYQCSDQTTQASCVTNISQTKKCFWAIDQCKEVSCENALQTLKTDDQCKQFLEQCTTQPGGGCVTRKECSDALIEEACVTNQWNEKCIWNGTSCDAAICQNAPSTYTTNQQCQQIHVICISNGKGCVSNYACGLAIEQQFCERDAYGNECYWNSNRCVLKTCSLPDNTYVGDEACSKFMYSCTGKEDGTGGCQEKTCSNAPTTLKTNEECDNYLPSMNCAAKKNGGCHINVICAYIDFKDGCTKDIQGNLCQWMESESKCSRIYSCSGIMSQQYCIIDQSGQQCQWENKKCIQKSCQTAPQTLTNEQQCQNYFTPKDNNTCTTVKGGGCRIKTYCEDADIEEACTSDFEGNSCFWHGTFCKLKQCSDIQESTFETCYMSQCTIGNDGYCDIMTKCNEFTSKYQCIQGIDGPCLWINNYNNKGACFLYESCNSMKWQTDLECKLISPYCTTDGNQCVSITQCHLTNTNGGCVTGIEGQCIQSVPSLGSQQSKQCQLFFNCSNAFYLTHDECQQASKYCTTNGTTGCRDLVACDYYPDENSCFINNIGIVKDNDQVISTGLCKWDNGLCRDENCSDFQYQTSSQCSQKLQKCTSNGKNCIEKQNCITYDESFCDIANGIEGPCQWAQGICKPLECQEIKQPVDQNSCFKSNCIFDGSKCIVEQKCSLYFTKIACSQNGSDGICVWSDQQNKCNLMSSCQSAYSDQNACIKANDRCTFSDNQCKELTCQTIFKKEGDCKYFPTWDYKKLNICQMKFGICKQIDIAETNETECIQYSLQMYRWNPISNKCSQCPDADQIKLSEKIIEIAESASPPTTQFSKIFWITFMIYNFIL